MSQSRLKESGGNRGEWLRSDDTDALSGVGQRDATIHQSIAVKVATGLELDNSWIKNKLQTLVAPLSRTQLAGWTELAELKIERKALLLKEKQLATKWLRRAVGDSSRGGGI